MPIPVVCQCGKKFRAKDEHAGLRTKCPACGQPLNIPKPAAEAALSAAAPAAGNLSAIAASAVESPLSAVPQESPPPSAPANEHPTYEGKRVGDWLDLLQVGDAPARKHAAEVLGTIGPEASSELPAIIKRLEAEHVLLRHWAVTCLEKIGPPAKAAVEALVARLHDDEPLIREKSAMALERIEPDCAAFVARLRRGLVQKDAGRRAAAVIDFRRDMKTLGVSRCRFWACACGCVYEKEDLDERLKLLADDATPDWQGTRRCKKCGQTYTLHDIYTGTHDVAQRFWPQLVKRFGDRVRVPDDLLSLAPPEEQSYELSDSQMFDALPPVFPGGVSAAALSFEPTSDDGYALAEAAPVRQGPTAVRAIATDEDLTPGATVPKTGQYKCTACHKVRMSESKSGLKTATPAKTVFKHFKAGKCFGECPHCRDLTEWQFIE